MSNGFRQEDKNQLFITLEGQCEQSAGKTVTTIVIPSFVIV